MVDWNLEDLISLNLTQGIGSVRFNKLIEMFGSTEEIFKASEQQLCRVNGVGPILAGNIKKIHSEGLAQKEMDKAREMGVTIVSCFDESFPHNLKHIPDPPIILYIKGKITDDDILSLAIVGSRRTSLYGQKQAERFATSLAAQGFTIISGIARGIDSIAHKGAIEAGGRTIGVIGNGIDVVYPPENEKLYAQIPQHGAIISEFPFGTAPLTGNFPRRNRVISGLALGVLVIEASARSGALLTAKWALEQGKEVFAMPGRIDAPMSRGCHRLIKDGAKLTESTDDILEELGPVCESLEPIANKEKGETTGRTLRLNDIENKVYAVLNDEAQSMDEILTQVDLPIHKITGALTTLGIKNIVKQLPGNFFVRNV